MGYFFWEAIPRSKDDSTRIAPFVAAELAKQDQLSELNDVNIPAPGEGNVLTYESPKWIAKAPAVGNGDLSWSRYRKIGRYLASPLMASSCDGAGSPTVNWMYATPYPIAIGETWDRIGVWLLGFTGHMWLAIYDDDGCYPGSLILNAGTLTNPTTGLKAIEIDQTLSAGLYWLVFQCDAPGTVYRAWEHNLWLVEMPADARDAMGSWMKWQAYGAPPATYPAGGTEVKDMWAIYARRSA